MTRLAFFVAAIIFQHTPVFAQGNEPAIKSGKILVSSHYGSATINQIGGLDSGKAFVRFRRELDDEVERCVREARRNDKGDIDSEEVAPCVKRGLKEIPPKEITRRAACQWRTVYTETGNFSLINLEKEPEMKGDGRTYRPIRTDWKDHRNEKIIGNCGGCGTPEILDTLRILCPKLYTELFKGYDPY